MKKFSKLLMVISISSFFAAKSVNAQEIVVRERLHRSGVVVVRRPFRPSPRHVWVAEEWVPGGGTYVYHAGYWALPPHRGTIWVAGHWRRRPGGFAWVPGHWSY